MGSGVRGVGFRDQFRKGALVSTPDLLARETPPVSQRERNKR